MRPSPTIPQVISGVVIRALPESRRAWVKTDTIAEIAAGDILAGAKTDGGFQAVVQWIADPTKKVKLVTEIGQAIDHLALWHAVVMRDGKIRRGPEDKRIWVMLGDDWTQRVKNLPLTNPMLRLASTVET